MKNKFSKKNKLFLVYRKFTRLLHRIKLYKKINIVFKKFKKIKKLKKKFLIFKKFKNKNKFKKLKKAKKKNLVFKKFKNKTKFKKTIKKIVKISRKMKINRNLKKIFVFKSENLINKIDNFYLKFLKNKKIIFLKNFNVFKKNNLKKIKKILKLKKKKLKKLKKKRKFFKPFWFKRRWIKFYWQKKRINKKLFLFVEFRKKFNNFFYIFRDLQNKKLMKTKKFNNSYELNSFIFDKYQKKQKTRLTNPVKYSIKKKLLIKNLYLKIQKVLNILKIIKTNSFLIKNIKSGNVISLCTKILKLKSLPGFISQQYFKTFNNFNKIIPNFSKKHNIKFKNFKKFYLYSISNFIKKKDIYKNLKNNKEFVSDLYKFNYVLNKKSKKKQISWKLIKTHIKYNFPIIEKFLNYNYITEITQKYLDFYLNNFEKKNYLIYKNLNNEKQLLLNLNKKQIIKLEAICKIKRKYIKIQGYFRRFLNKKVQFVLNEKKYSKIQIEYKKINLILKYRPFPMYYLEFNYNTLSFTIVNEFDFLNFPYKTLFDYKTIAHFYSR